MSAPTKFRTKPLSTLFDDLPRIKAVDVGASAIDGAPPYQPLLDSGHVELVGFEPDTSQYQKLQALDRPNTRYFPYAIGDGSPGVLHICQAPGMTSLLEPDLEVLAHFPGFRQWSEVIDRRPLDTIRLDDIVEAQGADYLKLDVQGGELAVLHGAPSLLEHTLVVHTEVQFVRFYQGQPLFGDLDQALRDAGFFFHRFVAMKSRVFQPMLINNDPYAGLSQQLWSDAVYVKRFIDFAQLDADQLLKIAVLLNDLYTSSDLAALALHHIDQKQRTQRMKRYVESLNPPRPTSTAAPSTERTSRGELNIGEAIKLGKKVHGEGDLQQAEQVFRQILSAAPANHVAWCHLAMVCHDAGQLDEAAKSYAQAIRLKPDFREAFNNFGNTLKRQGKFPQAIASFQQATQIDPTYTNAHFNLGVALTEAGRLDEAENSLRRALEIQPNHSAAHVNLGNVFKSQRKLSAAAASYQRALELAPNFGEVHNNLGNIFRAQAKVDQAKDCFVHATKCNPALVEAHSNLLLMYHYLPGVTLAQLQSAHAEWNTRHALLLKTSWQTPTNVPDPERPLRLGFISMDFCRHPVAYLLLGALQALDPKNFETVCYSDRLHDDDWTARIRAAAGTWRSVYGHTHGAVANQIRHDAIDILFDLSGHSAGHRLLVFARKPAPIQISWIGYVGTTGLEAMDYVLADAYHTPRGVEEYYQEEILRLPDGYVCYHPPDDAPSVAPLSALSRGSITFGSCNNAAKINRQVMEVWAEILRQVPRSRLVLKYGHFEDEATREHFLAQLKAQNVNTDRMELLGHSRHDELLAHYNQIDIALDPFPYAGGLTTCEALWMGVPVITIPGETFASRHSLSHLSNIGLSETIAEDVTDYVALAVKLADDLPRLAAMREGLRERMRQSPLCDATRFAANLSETLRDAWRRWCELQR